MTVTRRPAGTSLYIIASNIEEIALVVPGEQVYTGIQGYDKQFTIVACT